MKVKWPYWEWEDYQAGMYGLEWDGTTEDAVRLLSTPERLFERMIEAVAMWPKAAAHRLTDDGMNQQAWLGWAACALEAKVPAHLTRAAWWQLTEAQRAAANEMADKVIAGYRSPYAQTLFDD